MLCSQRPGSERIRAFCFLFNQSACASAQARDRWIAPPVSGGRSLTTRCEASSVLAEIASQNFADVAQQAERDHAMVEATSSRLVIRSTSGVSFHSAAA
jgi:hypothetical protein